MLIDSHCHPDVDDFDADRGELLARAREAGVTGLVAIGGGAAPGTLDVGLRTARLLDPEGGAVWATVGIHPHEAAQATEASFAELAQLAAGERVIAIGEIGLDYYYDHSPRDTQRAVFRRQMELARACGLPISIHCRDAWDECLGEIADFGLPRGGVFHCFTGTLAQARRAVEIGFYLSFSGMLTFRKAEELRQVAAAAPLDRILVETDSPFLAPVPYRGQRNEPAWVAKVAEELARLRGWTQEETARQTTANFARLFPKAACFVA